jgi:hypothetical protein
MIALFQQSVHNLPCRIVSIRHKVDRVGDRQGLDQAQHFVEQRALVTIGPHQALVNAHGKRHGEEARSRVYEQGDGLQGMSHDVFGFGAAIGLLMQELDGWHLLAAFGDLDAISDQDQPTVDAHRAREQPQHRLGPQSSEPIKLDRITMKVLAQRVIKVRPQIQCSYDAGDAMQLRSHHQADYDRGEPHETDVARKCRAQRLDRTPAGFPK